MPVRSVRRMPGRIACSTAAAVAASLMRRRCMHSSIAVLCRRQSTSSGLALVISEGDELRRPNPYAGVKSSMATRLGAADVVEQRRPRLLHAGRRLVPHGRVHVVGRHAARRALGIRRERWGTGSSRSTSTDGRSMSDGRCRPRQHPGATGAEHVAAGEQVGGRHVVASISARTWPSAPGASGRGRAWRFPPPAIMSTAPARRRAPGRRLAHRRIVAVGDVDEAHAGSSTRTGWSWRPGSSTSTRTTTRRCCGTRRHARRRCTASRRGRRQLRLHPRAARPSTPTT